MGQTQGRIGGSIFGTGITTDQKAPTRYVVSTGQSGLACRSPTAHTRG